MTFMNTYFFLMARVNTINVSYFICCISEFLKFMQHAIENLTFFETFPWIRATNKQKYCKLNSNATDAQLLYFLLKMETFGWFVFLIFGYKITLLFSAFVFVFYLYIY